MGSMHPCGFQKGIIINKPKLSSILHINWKSYKSMANSSQMTSTKLLVPSFDVKLTKTKANIELHIVLKLLCHLHE